MRADVARLVGWLQPKHIEPLPGGWTCETFSVDDAWIVQVGRTSYAANTLRHQARTLPKLAQHLGEKVPHPQLVSEGPTTMLYKKLAGTRSDEAPAGAWPEQLGALLSRLHAIAPKSIGLETVGTETLRADLREVCTRWLAVGGDRLSPGDRARAEQLLVGYLDDDRNWKFLPCPTHGDLGPEHVLVSATGDLVGVIDWEELRTGDPAYDVGWWLHEQPDHGKRILAAYGDPRDDRFLARARHAWSIMPWDEVEHGIATNDDAMIARGLDGVRGRL
jgi:aminoglycoside phosphotransferase (APT) family kinase protein